MGTLTITDVVAVLDSSFRQVFPDARPVKATIKEEAKAMQHPVENGASVVDHRVILPVEIKLSLILAGDAYRDVYQQIRQYWLRGDLLSVQTMTGTYQNMMISGMPHDETPELIDSIPMEISLIEEKIAATKFSSSSGGGAKGAPSSPRDSPTTPRGQQQGETPSDEKQNSGESTLHDILF
ncbi:hypothetical protein PL246_09500 [Salmonella enterica]|uniref:phage baseplate protein n=1 Tax=Salmonella enterica TaxID=28901 RepID=UPI001289AE1D|nr:hypothetical protein [Salmonella enterica]EBW5579129.1 hypothetical protein [Salmonella enterica subsp. enterica serovar Teddington]ECA1249944.1 hypothetical protein [Salmonella enterica subsp. enterica serovar Chailey]EDW6358925.1 hypothetical protein [Salmonella enterica subsp. enterica]HBJ6598209.1 hypothetical protein [Salmonella enterica subsp. enterica serovar Havana]ECA1852470.1 hypothetical protein [Salmonella enterica subsp. enterica serovar Chailey]